MKDNSKVSGKVVVLAIVVILCVCGVIGFAFYIKFNQPNDVVEEKLSGGSVSLTYSDDENLFVLESNIPTSDIAGKASDSADSYFDFTVRSILLDANSIEYEIILVKDDKLSTLDDVNVKVYLEKEVDKKYKEVVSPSFFTKNYKDSKLGGDAMSVFKYKVTDDASENYRLRMWVSDTAVLDSKEIQKYAVKVAVKGSAK